MPRSAILCCLVSIAVFCGAVFLPAGVTAQPKVPKTVETSGLELITPATQRAIQRGLEYLAASQHDDGAFGSGMYRKNVAVTALAGMAFLSAGNTPGRGKYGKEVSKTIDFLISATDPSGFITVQESASHGPMYGHGFATLFLAEVYGMTHRADLRDKVKLAVNVIVNSQNKEGGWRYKPVRSDADVSVTVCQIMALRAARNAGIFVPKNTVENCIKYVKQCQNSDGGFKYQLLQGSPSEWPRSAAGLVALYSAGIYEGREIDRGLRYLVNYQPEPGRGDLFRGDRNYFYGHYYAVQAMWHAGGTYWSQWYPAIRDELQIRQQLDGSWPDGICAEYGTAMSCVILQMPNNYLPIFQR